MTGERKRGAWRRCDRCLDRKSLSGGTGFDRFQHRFLTAEEMRRAGDVKEYP